jgi:phosphatidylglycerol:prolipoprotein diacylglycerol transferase
MKPVFISLTMGGRELGLHSYGILIACGFAIGIALAYREARRRGVDGGKILDLSFWILVVGLLGSRAFYVAVNAGDFARMCAGASSDVPRPLATVAWDCTRALHVWEGGLVFYGGFVAAAATVAWFTRRQGWSFWTIGDLFAPSLAIGHAFGRLGCYTAGCCFGKVAAAGARWTVAFPRDSVAFEELASAGAVPAGASFTPALYPTQLYEAAGELLIFALLIMTRRRAAQRPGTLFLLYATLYGLLRFAVELFRGDFARKYIIHLAMPGLAQRLGLPTAEAMLLSYGQLLSAAIIIGAVGVLLYRRGRGVSSAA